MENRQPHMSTAKQPITVELDVYSGRPNPSWTLSHQEITELSARLQGLAQFATVPTVDHLGYRGFLLHNADRQAGIAAEIRVYKGIIIITDQGSTSAFTDSKGLEQWLVTLARAQGQGQTLQAIGF